MSRRPDFPTESLTYPVQQEQENKRHSEEYPTTLPRSENLTHLRPAKLFEWKYLAIRD